MVNTPSPCLKRKSFNFHNVLPTLRTAGDRALKFASLQGGGWPVIGLSNIFPTLSLDQETGTKSGTQLEYL